MLYLDVNNWYIWRVIMTGAGFSRGQDKVDPMMVFRHFMNDSPQPFMIGYKNGRIIDFNRSFQELLGYSRD